jgi:hypothetical protein
VLLVQLLQQPAEAFVRGEVRVAQPRIACAFGKERTTSTTSRGCGGPDAMSPPTTIASTPSRSTSASTASRAGRLPWMS